MIKVNDNDTKFAQRSIAAVIGLYGLFLDIILTGTALCIETFCYCCLFVGVAPPSFVAIQAGTTLQQLTSSGDALSWQSVCILAVLAIVALLPVAFRAKLRQKFD